MWAALTRDAKSDKSKPDTGSLDTLTSPGPGQKSESSSLLSGAAEAPPRGLLENITIVNALVTLVTSYLYVGAAVHVNGGLDAFKQAYGVGILQAALASMTLPEDVASFLELFFIFCCCRQCLSPKQTGVFACSCPFLLIAFAFVFRVLALILPFVLITKGAESGHQLIFTCVDIVVALTGVILDGLLIQKAVDSSKALP